MFIHADFHMTVSSTVQMLILLPVWSAKSVIMALHSGDHQAQFSHLVCNALTKNFSFSHLPRSRLIPSAITISLSHSVTSLTNMSFSFSSERLLVLSLSLRLSPVWDLTGTEELPLVTTAKLMCYVTFKLLFIIQRPALTLKSCRISQVKVSGNYLKLCLLHFHFDRYLSHLP